MMKRISKLSLCSLIAAALLARPARPATVVFQYQTPFGQASTPTVSVTPNSVPLWQTNTLVLSGMATYPWPTNGLAVDAYGNTNWWGWTNNAAGTPQLWLPLSAGAYTVQVQGFPRPMTMAVPVSTSTYFASDLSSNVIVLTPTPNFYVYVGGVATNLTGNATNQVNALALAEAQSVVNTNVPTGNGAGLTNIPATSITGIIASATSAQLANLAIMAMTAPNAINATGTGSALQTNDTRAISLNNSSNIISGNVIGSATAPPVNIGQYLNTTGLVVSTEGFMVNNRSKHPAEAFAPVLAKAQTNQAVIIILGDSMSGYGVYTSIAKWLAAMMQYNYGWAGDYCFMPYGSGYVESTNRYVTNFWFGVSAFSTQASDAGNMGVSYQQAQQSGDPYFITEAHPANQATLFWVQQPFGGTMNWQEFPLPSRELNGFNVPMMVTLNCNGAGTNMFRTNIAVALNPTNRWFFSGAGNTTGTNIIIGSGFGNTNSTGFVIYWLGDNGQMAAGGSTTLSEMASVGTNLLREFSALVKPDAILYNAKDWPEENTVQTYTNAMTAVLGTNGLAQTNTAVIIFSTMPSSSFTMTTGDTASNNACYQIWCDNNPNASYAPLGETMPDANQPLTQLINFDLTHTSDFGAWWGAMQEMNLLGMTVSATVPFTSYWKNTLNQPSTMITTTNLQYYIGYGNDVAKFLVADPITNTTEIVALALFGKRLHAAGLWPDGNTRRLAFWPLVGGSQFTAGANFITPAAFPLLFSYTNGFTFTNGGLTGRGLPQPSPYDAGDWAQPLLSIGTNAFFSSPANYGIALGIRRGVSSTPDETYWGDGNSGDLGFIGGGSFSIYACQFNLYGQTPANVNANSYGINFTNAIGTLYTNASQTGYTVNGSAYSFAHTDALMFFTDQGSSGKPQLNTNSTATYLLLSQGYSNGDFATLMAIANLWASDRTNTLVMATVNGDVPYNYAMPLANWTAAPSSNDFVRFFGQISGNTTTNHLDVNLNGARMDFWTTNGATINSKQLAP